MSVVRLVSQRSDLIATVCDTLLERREALDRTVVVFPGKRPRLFLLRALAASIGVPFIPPLVFSIESFMEKCRGDLTGTPSRALSRIDTAMLLYSGAADKRSAPLPPLNRFLASSIDLIDEMDGLARNRVQQAKLLEAAAAFGLPELSIAAALYPVYTELREQGYHTSGLDFLTVAEHIDELDLEQYEHIVIAGFFAPTECERVLFKRLYAAGNVEFIFHDGPGMTGQIARLGFTAVPEEHAANDTPHNQRLSYIAATDVHAEVFGLNSVLSSMDKPGASDIGTLILLPDPSTLQPLLNHTLPLLPQHGYNVSLGFSIRQTPVFGFLKALLNAASSWSSDTIETTAYLRCMSHPYTKNMLIGRSAVPMRMLSQRIEAELAKTPGHSRLKLEDMERSSPVLTPDTDARSGEPQDPDALHEALMQAHRTLLLVPARARTIGELARALMAAMELVSGHGTAHMHPYFASFGGRVMDALLELVESTASATAFDDVQFLTNFVEHYVGDISAPLEGTPLGGVQVLGLLEARSLRFNKVIVLDANDDCLPGDHSSRGVIPQGIRDGLGMQTALDLDAITEYHFAQTLSSAEEVHLFYTTSDGHDRSRYVERLLWQEQQSENALPKDHEQSRIKQLSCSFVLSGGTPAALQKSPAAAARLQRMAFSPTALDTWLNCGRRFYFQYVLRLSQKVEPGAGADYAALGNVVHKTLQELLKPLMNTRLTPERLPSGSIDSTLEAVFRDVFGEHVDGPVLIVRDRIQKRLHDYFTYYEAGRTAEDDVRITGIERMLSVDRNGNQLTGKADRIEQWNGMIVISDYKTGSLPTAMVPDKLDMSDTATWKPAIGSIQLPMYILMAGTMFDVPVESIDAYYIHLGARTVDRKINVHWLKDPERKAEALELTGRILDAVLSDIKNPDVPFHAPADTAVTCRYCPYAVMCGIGSAP
jgi:hypothetical protein